jgi:signal transduction histidine kinase
VLLVVVHLIGSNSLLRRDYLRALEERAERLEHERDVADEVAAVRERTRIARELHDVVAHHVSVMVVQAEGAGWAIQQRPEQARTAIATIASTGRTALSELRRLLGVLRDDDEDGVAPQPGLGDLHALLTGFRTSGLVVEAELPSDPDLSPSLQLAAYRIVQEGLTNALKHAGPGTRVQVAVGLADDVLTVQIQDDGARAPASGHLRASGVPTSGRPRPSDPPSGSAAGAPTGHGLVGIGERAALFGGTVDTGPLPDTGFRVLVTLPVERTG